MTAKRITETVALTVATDDDVMPIVDDPAGSAVTKKMTFANVRKYVLDLLLTTRGDIPYRNATVAARLALGASTAKLKSDGADILWGPAESGTSFPGSPATNDRFFRTDRGIEYYYNGTRWLSVNLYDYASFFVDSTTQPFSATGYMQGSAPWAGIYDLWLVDFWVSFYVSGGTALSGSHKWDLALTSQPAGTSLATSSIASGASSAWRAIAAVAIGALLGVTNVTLQHIATKTGTPGNLYVQPRISYRLVG